MPLYLLDSNILLLYTRDGLLASWIEAKYGPVVGDAGAADQCDL